jgi:hypothetical protein
MERTTYLRFRRVIIIVLALVSVLDLRRVHLRGDLQPTHLPTTTERPKRRDMASFNKTLLFRPPFYYLAVLFMDYVDTFPD